MEYLLPLFIASTLLVEFLRKNPGVKEELPEHGVVTGAPTAFLSSMLLMWRAFMFMLLSCCRKEKTRVSNALQAQIM